MKGYHWKGVWKTIAINVNDYNDFEAILEYESLSNLGILHGVFRWFLSKDYKNIADKQTFITWKGIQNSFCIVFQKWCTLMK